MIHNVTTYISDKVEEFRIVNGSPSYLAITVDIHDRLKSELEMARNQKSDGLITEFNGLPVIIAGGGSMPKDGVYIHKSNGSNG